MTWQSKAVFGTDIEPRHSTCSWFWTAAYVNTTHIRNGHLTNVLVMTSSSVGANACLRRWRQIDLAWKLIGLHKGMDIEHHKHAVEADSAALVDRSFVPGSIQVTVTPMHGCADWPRFICCRSSSENHCSGRWRNMIAAPSALAEAGRATRLWFWCRSTAATRRRTRSIGNSRSCSCLTANIESQSRFWRDNVRNFCAAVSHWNWRIVWPFRVYLTGVMQRFVRRTAEDNIALRWRQELHHARMNCKWQTYKLCANQNE